MFNMLTATWTFFRSVTFLCFSHKFTRHMFLIQCLLIVVYLCGSDRLSNVYNEELTVATMNMVGVASNYNIVRCEPYTCSLNVAAMFTPFSTLTVNAHDLWIVTNICFPMQHKLIWNTNAVSHRNQLIYSWW